MCFGEDHYQSKKSQTGPTEQTPNPCLFSGSSKPTRSKKNPKDQPARPSLNNLNL